ncbi:hypothetical protein BT96DRAFT_934073 [Gymnopus androsaceus JB14]|uniref:Uncharacterized protein n=1 Tax=Gymnopus androsaceus JB14 TaxID=1447944 RepID=A0A6A4I7C2_9AGAR|nr:hypothetical protein BT96DRAFT_934073 [Gymnopus androsaceus JB14]
MSSNDSGFPLEIPNELYGLILDFVCDENFLQEHPWLDHHPDNEPFTEVSSSPLRDLPALVISAVCTRWRSIALSSPAFWSKLRLELLFTDASTMSKGLASTLELYLQRSNHCPLYIDLNITGKLRNDSAVIPLASLTRCAQFWKSFRYRGDFRSLIHLQNFSQLHFPILENLDVRATGMVAGDLFTCFQNAPSLCAITATAKPGFFEAAELPLRHRLTSLDLIISSRCTRADLYE